MFMDKHLISSLPRLFACSLMATLISCQANLVDDAAPTASTSAQTVTQQARSPARKPVSASADSAQEPAPGFSSLWERMQAGLALQQYYEHPDVTEELQRYTDNQAYFDLTVARAEPFLYSIVDELDRRGLPQELALLPFVESAFNPSARSTERAVGLWQFMGATATSFGLQQDWWYDARRDPFASTTAALDYLEELHQQFDGDWLLALAAYNAGDGTVRRALRRRKQSDNNPEPFWDLALPRETRAHVPRVLALARLINDSTHYGIVLAPIANSDPLERVDIGAQIDLSQVAELAGMDYPEVRALNPGYLQWATHPEQPQHVFLPRERAQRLAAQLASLPAEDFITWDHYLIQPGDTLSKIARKLDTRVDVLQRVNELRGTRIIAGDSLLIPRGTNSEAVTSSPYASAYRQTPSAPTRAVPGTYRIRSGDNLWSIARRFDLHSSDIALWNGITTESILYPGQIIVLSPDSNSDQEFSEVEATATTYIVRRGDSMARIATRFNTNLDELLKRNNLNSSSVIFPGQVIQITPVNNGIN